MRRHGLQHSPDARFNERRKNNNLRIGIHFIANVQMVWVVATNGVSRGFVILFDDAFQKFDVVASFIAVG